jgi:phosphoserine aminotransferase
MDSIVRKNILTATASPSFLHALGIPSPPTVLYWPTVYKNNSLYNTLELLPVYIANLVIRNLLDVHGIDKLRGQERLVNTKSDKIYVVLDSHPEIYRVVPDKSIRSRMNICVRVKGGDEAAEKAFLKGAEDRKLQGLKGHRSVGGIRVSNYNAVTLPQVEKLVEYLEEFAKTYP